VISEKPHGAPANLVDGFLPDVPPAGDLTIGIPLRKVFFRIRKPSMWLPVPYHFLSGTPQEEEG
jgi:hypothetical protein